MRQGSDRDSLDGLLKDFELRTAWWVVREQVEDEGEPQQGPLGTLAWALRKLKWTFPSPAAFCDHLGNRIALAEHPPGFWKKYAVTSFTAEWDGKLDRLMNKRHDLEGVSFDWDMVRQAFRSKSFDPWLKSILLQVAWGVVPTGEWRHAHGLKDNGLCLCGQADDLTHWIEGCHRFDRPGPIRSYDAKQTASSFLSIMKLAEAPIADRRASELAWFVDGKEVDGGLFPGWRAQDYVYVDGSGYYPTESRLRVAGAAAVQLKAGDLPELDVTLPFRSLRGSLRLRHGLSTGPCWLLRSSRVLPRSPWCLTALRLSPGLRLILGPGRTIAGPWPASGGPFVLLVGSRLEPYTKLWLTSQLKRVPGSGKPCGTPAMRGLIFSPRRRFPLTGLAMSRPSCWQKGLALLGCGISAVRSVRRWSIGPRRVGKAAVAAERAGEELGALV